MANLGIWMDDGASGSSDASFRRRKHYQIESVLFARLSPASSMGLHKRVGAGMTPLQARYYPQKTN